MQAREWLASGFLVEALHIAQLTRERDNFKLRLDKALLVIDVQKKLAALLGNPINDTGGLP